MRVCVRRHLRKSCRRLKVKFYRNFWGIAKFCVGFTETQCCSMRNNLSHFRRMLSYFKDHLQVNSLYEFKGGEIYIHTYVHIYIHIYIHSSLSAAHKVMQFSQNHGIF